MSVGVGIARRLRQFASDRSLAGTDPGPVGTVSSLQQWAREHADHCGARWMSSPTRDEAPLREARTASGGPVRAFEAAVSDFNRLASQTARASVDAALLPGARLASADGLVLTHDDLLASESAWDQAKLEASGLLGRRRLPRAQTLPGRHASLISQWCGAYYHWITDALPRIAVLEATDCADAALIVPAQFAPWQRRSLELLGYGDRITPHPGYLRAETLLWPRPAALTGHTPQWACEWLHRRLATDAPPTPRSRLYLSRRGERRRRVANEEDVWALLEPLGFELIEPGRLTLDAQIELFASAGVVVSPHGGALTNIAFARGATVIELFEPGYLNVCYYVLAQRSGHEYWYLVGAPARNGDFTVDVSELGRTLAAAALT